MNRRAFECPQCRRPVHLTMPVAVPQPSGSVLIDMRTVVAALNLHLRVGCERSPR